MSELGRLARNLAFLSGGEIASRLLTFLAFAFLARALEPAPYGAVELAATLFLFFRQLLDFGLGAIGSREVSRSPQRASALAASIPSLRLLLALVLVPAMCLAPVIMQLPAQATRLIRLFALSLVASVWVQRWLFQGLERMSWISAAQLLRSAVFAALVLVWVREPADLLAVGVAHVVGQAAESLLYAGAQHRLVTPVRLDLAPRRLTALARESLPLAGAQAVWSVCLSLPMLLLAALVGGSEPAWFGAGQRVTLALATLGWLYHFNLYPALSRRLARSQQSYWSLMSASYRVTAWSVLLLGLLCTLLAGRITRLLFGPGFERAAPCLAIMIWLVPLTLLSGHARGALVIGGSQRGLFLAQLAGALVTLGLGPFFVLAWGAVGAAFVSVAAAAVIWVVAQALAHRLSIPVPFLGSLGKPAGIGILAAASGVTLGGGAWGSATIASLIVVAGCLLLDRELIGDLERLLSESAPPMSTASATNPPPGTD